MGGHSPEEIRQETRKYIMVFAALGALTIITVAISYLHLSIVPAVFLGMTVATIKASLVACYFMHLIDEKRTIYGILALTAIFFVFLMVLPGVTTADGTGESIEVPHATATEH